MATNPGHHTTPEAFIGAWLHGTASRHASMRGWRGPEGAAREAALAELWETATIGGKLRTDLLARQAGICLGASRLGEVDSPLRARMAELLLAAGGDTEPDVVEQWAQRTHQRLSGGTGREPEVVRPGSRPDQ